MADLVNGWLMSNALDSATEAMKRRKAEEKQNELASLAAQAYSAPEESRQNALNALAQRDVGAAFGIEKGLAQREEYTREQVEANRQDILRGIGILETLDPLSQAREFPNIVSTIKDPMIRRALEGKRFEEVAPMLPQLKQQLMAQMSQADTPAAFRAKDMQARAAGYMPGTPEYQQFMQAGVTRARPATAKVEFLDDGTAVVLDPNTGTFRLATQADMGAAQPPPAMPDDSALVDQVGQWGMAAIEQLVQRGVPRPEAEAIVEPMMQQRLAQPRTMESQPQPTAPTKIGPSKAETAAAVEAAKLEAQRGDKKEIRINDAREALDMIDRAEGLIGISTGSGAGALRDKAYAFFGKSTTSADAIASLEPIAGALIGKVPRFEGPQSDKDTALYRAMAGDLANPNIPTSRRLSALREMRRLYQKFLAQPRQEFLNQAPAQGGWSIQEVR